MKGGNRKGVNIMLHSKVVVSNIVKAVVITLLIFSCTPSTKADEADTLIQKLIGTLLKMCCLRT